MQRTVFPCSQQGHQTTLEAEFAHAIAARTTDLLVHVGHNEYEPMPWVRDLPSVPYAVFVQDYAGAFKTLPFDFDGPGAARDAEIACQLLNAAGVRHMVALSGPNGNRHVLATFSPPVPLNTVHMIRDRAKARCPSLDICPLSNPTHGAIRPPLAPHRHGGRSDTVGDPLEALRTLLLPNEPTTIRALLVALGVPEWEAETTSPRRSQRETVALLTARTRGRLATGKKSGGDSSASGVRMSVILGCINSGLTFAETLDLLMEPGNMAGGGKSGPQVHAKRDIDMASRRLWDEWTKGAKHLKVQPSLFTRTEFLTAINKVRDAGSGPIWGGGGGASASSVFTAIVTRATREGSLEIVVSHRVLSEDAKLGRWAASRGLDRVQAAGLVEIISVDSRPGGGTRLRLIVPLASQYRTNTYVTTGGVSIGSVLGQTQHDAFRNDSSARLTHSALDLVTPVTVRQIADGTGRSRSTIYRNLGRLERLGLAERRPNGTWVRMDRDLQEIAEETCRDGMTEEQHARHAAERNTFRASYEEEHGKVEEVIDADTGNKHWIITLGRAKHRDDVGRDDGRPPQHRLASPSGGVTRGESLRP